MSQADLETVQETQPDVGPSTKRRQHRKRVPGEPRAKVTQMAWSSEEQIALCRAWLDVTEDPASANYQKDKTYWRRITQKFHAILNKPPYRDQDVVSSKWKKMRPVIQSFNQIFHRLSEKNNHLSGASDADLQNMALAEHHGLGGPALPFLTEWTMLRRSSKFLEIMK
uniref:glutathione S-transferase T3-like n=1 Tax=Erigeron canadensis TaxID=72917 RepID=UPI001CB91E5A|nr:glutathione S-transferase T3-like [Erigeron canadensis]